MKWLTNRATWGILLILAGVLFLVQNTFFPNQGGLIFAGLFGLAGLYFLVYYIVNRQQWWPLLPGIILLGLGILIGGSELSESFSENWGGPFFLGMIGVAFLLVYLVNHSNWWAIIPGGVLLTLAFVATPFVSSGTIVDGGAVFFLGLGLTFAALGVIPTPEGRRLRWAFIPAIVLFVMGAVIAVAAADLLGWILPAFLILGGILILAQTLWGRKTDVP